MEFEISTNGSTKGYTMEFKQGFTWKSALALIIASAVFLPIDTYLVLVSGATISGAAVYILVILFTELATFIGVRMTKQEITIVFVLAGAAAGSAVYLGMVFRQYFATSFLTWSFKDPYTGKPLPELIPPWWAPPYYSDAAYMRTFFHWDWFIPMIVANMQLGLFWILQEVGLAIICSQIFIEAQPLQFPLAQVNAQLITTLSERDVKRMKYFTVAAIAGGAYSIVVYGLPTLTLGMFNVPMQIIPIPWVDFTSGFYGIEQFMPGALFGIATDPLSWAVGLLLPLDTLAYMLIGSLAIWTFGNWLSLTYFRDFFPQWVAEWRRGMNLSLVWQRSYLRVWVFPSVGFIFALAFITIVRGWRSFVAAFKALAKLTFSSATSATGFPSLSKVLAIYLTGAIGSLIFFGLLVPDFPIWVAALVIPLSFVMAIASTRARGETGLIINVPYMWNILVLFSDYPKVDAWFFSPNIGGTSAPLWVEGIKTAYLTETKPIDFFKAYALTVLLYQVFSFVYVSFFWSIAPIPSSQYPYTMAAWPVQIISQSIWISREIAANITAVVNSFVGMLLIGVVGILLNRYLSLPFSFVGLVTGTTTVVPYPMAMFLGGLVGKIVEKYVGREIWINYKTVIVAGIACGVGVTTGIIGSITLMSKSAWIKPF